MSSYTISKSLNPKRVFILQKSELEKRLDPFFYVPELLELEKKVLAKKPKKLRDYIVSVSSGATPKTTESELYYAEKENGIPFLRVQNLSPTGVLEFDDCKYINKETHNGMLKRSQVSAGDLLVKITGVGRMAIASIAPEGFIGNINQHVCVIKTGSKEISETLAAFLNSDIGEKLASRRSAGGTRPALDYPALLSIPIIEDKRILKITNKVIAQKQKNEAETEKLLSSIDEYLLKELGIKLPEPPENTLKNRMFTRTLKEIANKRIDPFFHQNKFIENLKVIGNGKYPVKTLREIIIGNLIKGSLPKQEEKDGECSVVQINSINADGTISLDDLLTSKNIFSKSQKLIKEDVLVVITGATIGKVAFWNYPGEYFLGGDIVKFQTNPLADNAFVYHFLRSGIMQIEIKRNITGATNGHLAHEDIAHLPIPVPPIDKQKEIANHITEIRNKAQQLKDKTKEVLKIASEEIEEILLN
ncbi:MAG: restriction endonuclease subunit S, partial [Bacteroidia bacterium]|nr:restriction endonuclease subunit S [Bacteroidia bacterium]MCF8428074.1 restriction endonuclease subunit S [Bacteroidia bacterium]MCF8448096.1 restriction endonuclease subunit S [Bacteroidia bacterium]